MENVPIIEFKYGFTEVDEFEMPMKGYRGDVIAKCPNGKNYELYFYDPVRLAQDLEVEEIMFEVGLTIVKDVTKENIEKAVAKMWKEGFFDKLKEV
jgi:hypothetical protein